MKAIRGAGRALALRNTVCEPIKEWREQAPEDTGSELGRSPVLEDNLATA